LDARYDDFSIVPVGGVVGHPEGLEAFPCPALLVPKIFDSGAARIGNGLSFIATTESQRVTSRVEDERVAKNGCLRTSAWDAGSDFAKPTLTLSQKLRMLFQNEHFNFLSLGVAKSQFISGMLGPLPCTKRWT
jgi:hypothetical protein